MKISTLLTALFAIWLTSAAWSQPSLSLTARLDQARLRVGDEFRLEVQLVNRSQKTIELHYMKPWTVVPEIWDAAGKTRLPNAPSVVFDQIVVPESVRLKPQASLALVSIPVVIGPISGPEIPGVTRAHWESATPGSYRLRYRVNLADCIPGASGSITSNDVRITLQTGQAHMTGVLGFAAGQGYFLTVDPARNEYRAKRVWLLVSENKVLVGQLDSLRGRRVTIRGDLRRLKDNQQVGAFPARAVYLVDFTISENQ